MMMSSRVPVSVVVLTHDEEPNIESCLRTIVDWAGEVFVVDSGSTDRTLEIVSRYTLKVAKHLFENYSRQRNWAQSNLPLSYEWVFHIDADERVTPELADGLRKFFADEAEVRKVDGLLVRRRIQFMGRDIVHGGIYPTYHCRIYRKERGRCEDREYDQHFLVDGLVETIEADLIEVTASSLFAWTAKHNRWAQMEARHLLQVVSHQSADMVKASATGSPIQRRRWLRASVFERSPLFLRAALYFSVRYFLRGGFLDGTPGLIYHVLHGLWFRFYTDACLYELRHQADHA
jgi:glycosyltransferase involved in cell wall biosynthesis